MVEVQSSAIKSLCKLVPALVAGFFSYSKSWRHFWKTYSSKVPREFGPLLSFNFKRALKKQIQLLKKKDKWDQAALQEYIKRVQERTFKQTRPQEIFEAMAKEFEQTQVVGSEVYTQMYLASRLRSKKKLRLVLRHLGARVDQFGFLQLTGGHLLAQELLLNELFYGAFRFDVCQVYANEDGLKRDSLGQRIHLFRSWLDRQNLNYVRQNYRGDTDFAKLQNYAYQTGQSLDLTTNASFHNRTQGNFTYPKYMKIQVPASNTLTFGKLNNARMVEFIVDLTTEKFVSEWNVYHETTGGQIDSDPNHYDLTELAQVANTESLNYGIPHGQQHDMSNKEHAHYDLDVYHPNDPEVRKFATKIFHSPKTMAKGGNYVDLIKHLSDLRVWQSIPLNQKPIVYSKYLESSRNKGIVKGIAHSDNGGNRSS
ncbi:DUF3114 domain-containing protein [Ligilactobacillus pobuzihii]|uniref:DUF3114 domain-containing protein n=1 Tax=Ligilactobacillus pobuzihii TaxID=449659 RepID=UPI0003735BC5|nr:DUF3114 domain-containing protein [Ligilactobacillus pobuzihii]GEN48014.1 hypothetical protein LPO01_08060 [Ligilactobacillus pobuzihii]